MKPTEFWKNFKLGEELSVSGTFIYNGLRQFHEMPTLDYTDELFDFLYSLSVGLERLLKIVVVLLEHDDRVNQEDLEKSLITHSHQDLLRRVNVHQTLNLGPPHNEFLALLGTFYRTLRYDRFSLSSVYDAHRERRDLCAFIGKHLNIEIKEEPSGILATKNEDRYRKFVRRVVTKISSELYAVVRARARELNLYTYELRHDSKAQTVFLGQADVAAEEVLWKELLVFLMNTKSSSGWLEFLRGIEPLPFDQELIGDYLQCFQSNAAKATVMGELETLYDQVKDSGQRLEMMSLLGSSGVYFDEPEAEDTDELDGPD